MRSSVRQAALLLPRPPHLRQDAGHAQHGPAAVHALRLGEPGQALLVGAQAQRVKAVAAGQLAVLQVGREVGAGQPVGARGGTHRHGAAGGASLGLGLARLRRAAGVGRAGGVGGAAGGSARASHRLPGAAVGRPWRPGCAREGAGRQQPPVSRARGWVGAPWEAGRALGGRPPTQTPPIPLPPPLQPGCSPTGARTTRVARAVLLLSVACILAGARVAVVGPLGI